MKVKIILAFAFWASLFMISCNRDEISFDAPSQLLRFSQDTVFCDTVYNQMRSETYAVKIYNDEDKDIKIPHLFLAGGSSSPYRINVDGKPGVDFTEVPLRKKDSLYIFVEIAPVANAPEAIAKDSIMFESPVGKQYVSLFSVVQDAEYFIKTDTNPNIISQNTTWNNNKAKVIFGDLTLAEGKTLTIEKGTQVVFHKNSGLKISKNAILDVNGILGKEVVFRGDRADRFTDEGNMYPLNWNSVEFDTGTQLNMDYAKIFGGTSGLMLKETTANIKNTIIHSFQEYGIYAVKSTVNAQNLAMNNCGETDFAIFKGGKIDLTHCTLANFWDLNSSLPALSIYATNEWTNEAGTTENGSLDLKIKNSILYSEADNAAVFKPVSGQTFSYNILNSLLKYGSNAGFTFDGNTSIVSSLKNQDPKFENYFTQKMNLRVKSDSPVRGKGNMQYIDAITKYDIVGILRGSNPTLGAYE